MKKLLITAAVFMPLTTIAQPVETTKGWENIILGAGVIVKPEYTGSDEYETLPLPFISATYNLNADNSVSFTPISGLSYVYSGFNHLEIGLSARPNFGRDNDDVTHLNGMNDIDPTVEFGPWVKFNISDKVNLGAAFYYDLGSEHEGFLVEASADYETRVSERIIFKAGLGTTYASDDYMESFYSVSAAQALPTRSAFVAGAGFESVEAKTGIMYLHNRKWFSSIDAVYTHLLGDAADSSLTKEEGNLTGVFTIGYRF